MVRGASTQLSGAALRSPAIPALRPQLPALTGLQWAVRSSDLGFRDMELIFSLDDGGHSLLRPCTRAPTSWWEGWEGWGGTGGTLPSPRGGRRGGKGGRGVPCPPLRGRKSPFFIMQKTKFRRRFRVVFS